MTRPLRYTLLAAAFALALTVPAPPAGSAVPEGGLTWGVHIALAPTFFDPAETPGLITPFMVLYALHDAMVKPMPGQARRKGLAESWSLSKDGLVWEFVLRKNVRFHNGETMTAEDVKFSFERYRGAGAKLLKEKVAGVDATDPQRVRFRLHRPWPDFLTFYGTPATGAAWVVPKKYVEKVGASEMCTAHVSVPSGVATAGRTGPRRASATTMTRRTLQGVRVIESLRFVAEQDDRDVKVRDYLRLAAGVNIR